MTNIFEKENIKTPPHREMIAEILFLHALFSMYGMYRFLNNTVKDPTTVLGIWACYRTSGSDLSLRYGTVCDTRFGWHSDDCPAQSLNLYNGKGNEECVDQIGYWEWLFNGTQSGCELLKCEITGSTLYISTP